MEKYFEIYLNLVNAKNPLCIAPEVEAILNWNGILEGSLKNLESKKDSDFDELHKYYNQNGGTIPDTYMDLEPLHELLIKLVETSSIFCSLFNTIGELIPKNTDEVDFELIAFSTYYLQMDLLMIRVRKQIKAMEKKRRSDIQTIVAALNQVQIAFEQIQIKRNTIEFGKQNAA